LVAYVVPSDPQQAPSRGELRQHLRRRLPDYMLPQRFVMLEALPLTPNGKIDRRALPAPELTQTVLDQNYAGARTPLEEMVQSIWEEVLGVEQIGLWQLHRIDTRVPRAEQFGAVKQLLDEGVIRHAGLSEVSVDQIKQASQVFRVATVQNSYNLADRESDDVVDYCEANGIGFIPYYPLGGDGELTRPGGALDKIAKAKGIKPGQVALAWLLKRSPAMLPIPGTSKLAHLEENAAAAALTLTDEEFSMLDRKKR